MNKLIKKLGGNWIFLLVAIAISIIVWILFPMALSKTMVAFWEILRRILPVLAGVVLLMFLFNLFLDTKRVAKYLGKSAGIWGWLLAIIFGIISMGSLYIWYPMLADLQRKGMDNGLIAVFLYNQAIKIQLLPFLIYYFSWQFVLVLTAYMIIFSIVNGWLVNKFVPSKPLE